MSDEVPKLDRELVEDCLNRISAGDKDAAFDLAQLYMARVVHKDVNSTLDVIEGLARQSAALGSEEAAEFLSSDWPELRLVFERRLTRVLRSDS